MENYDKEAASLTRALKRKSFHNVKVRPRLKTPEFVEVDSDSIAVVFADESVQFGKYEELLRRIETADSEQALLESFDNELT